MASRMIIMTFKEFSNWCYDRACDGCWGMNEAIICMDVGTKIRKLPFYKRNKEWDKLKDSILNEIVFPTNNKIQEYIKQNS